MHDFLTEKKIKELRWGGTTETIRDERVPGFFLTVNKTCKSYKIQADLWQGPRGRRRLVRSIRHTIGTTDTHSLSEARNVASELLSKIKRGHDPFPERRTTEKNCSIVLGDPVAWTVEEMILGYIRVLEAREAADRSIFNVREAMERYMKPWLGRPAIHIRKSDARDLHNEITRNHGKVAANRTLRYFRAAYNVAEVLSDDENAFDSNPVRGVIFHKERSSDRVILPEDLSEWWRKIQAIENPIRREMHLLSLLGGLRPGTATAILRAWIDISHRAIRFPEMKSSRAFDLPLSTQMIDCVERAQELGDMLYPGSPWLFSTRARDRSIVYIRVVRERSMPSETGHILRHTHRTMAQHERINPINGKLLLDHKVPGIDGVYIHDRALFLPLLQDQQVISDAMFRFMEDKRAILEFDRGSRAAAE